MAIESVEVDPPSIISDHGSVSCCKLIQSYSAKQFAVQVSLPEAGGEWTHRLSSRQSGNSPIGGSPKSSDQPKNYRPVSNLTFVSKMTERIIVTEQLVE